MARMMRDGRYTRVIGDGDGDGALRKGGKLVCVGLIGGATESAGWWRPRP
jgi:hypothetical protein